MAQEGQQSGLGQLEQQGQQKEQHEQAGPGIIKQEDGGTPGPAGMPAVLPPPLSLQQLQLDPNTSAFELLHKLADSAAGEHVIIMSVIACGESAGAVMLIWAGM